MARVTVEDCIDKVDSPYELVLVAKERATQLNSGLEATIEKNNDKNTVISLREIAEEKIKVKDLVESAVYKLRKHVEQVDDAADDDEAASGGAWCRHQCDARFAEHRAAAESDDAGLDGEAGSPDSSTPRTAITSLPGTSFLV